MIDRHLQALLTRIDETLDTWKTESNPSTWPGAKTTPARWSQTTRGNRYWCKRNANESMKQARNAVAMAQQLIELEARMRQRTFSEAGEIPEGVPVPTTDEELDAAHVRAERAVDAALSKLKALDVGPR